jgi:hypothetical protein
MNADTVKNSNPNWVIPTNEENATGDDENEEVFFFKKNQLNIKVIPIQLFIQLIDDYHKLPTAERIHQETQ